MTRNLLLLSLIFIYSCNNIDNNENEALSSGELIEIANQEDYFNLKKQSPLTKLVPKNIHIKEQKFVNKIANSNTGIDWYSRGPFNVGGRTRALALDINNDARIIIGGVSGGVWISEDLGESFDKATTPSQFHSITCLAQDASTGNNNIWYYGTGEQNGNSSDLMGNGIYKSIDNGLTWSLLESTTNDSSKVISSLGDFSYVKDIKVNPINGDVVVACFTGIFLSQNGGETWTNTLVGGANPNGFGYVNFGKQTNIDISSSGTYYATLSSDCVDKGIYKSTDGIAWTNITPTNFASAYRRIESGISPSNTDQVFFIADVSTTVPLADNHQLWKYNEINNSWIDKTANIPFGSCTGFFDFDFGYYQTQNSYDMYISVHPSDTNLIFLGGTNLYRSTDGFSSPAYTWVGGYFCDPSDPGNYVYPNHHPDNHASAFVPNSDIMISAHDGGISITDDCKATKVLWRNSNNGYNTSQFYTVTMEHGNTDNDVIMGGLQDNGTFYTNSLDPKQDWMWSFYGDGAYCAITENRENYYVSWQGGKTFKALIDDDGNIENISRIDPSGASGFAFINSFILDPSNQNTMYLAGGKFLWRNDSLNHIPLTHEEYVTNDMGWEKITVSNVQPFSLPGSQTARISTVNMSESSTDVVYYGTNSGSVFKLTGLDSKNYNKTNIKSSNMPNGAYTSCIEVDNTDENKLLVCFSNYEVNSIFYSEDAGANFDNVSGNLEEFENGSGAGPSVNWVHIHNDGSKNIYLAGTTSGLFSTETLDGINTIWAREGYDKIGNVPIHMIDSRTYDNNILIATHGNGIFSSKETISSIDDITTNKKGFYLSNIYPNPVKDKMKFSFRIDHKAFVSLKIYDINGREVSQLENAILVKGTYEKRWFVPNNLTKGIYNLVLSVDSKILNKQFVLK